MFHAYQRIHIKYRALFSLKNFEKYSRMSSTAVVFGALRVNFQETDYGFCISVKKHEGGSHQNSLDEEFLMIFYFKLL